MIELFEWLDMAAVKAWLISCRSSLTPRAAAALLAHLFVLFLTHLRSFPLAILPRYMRKDGLKPPKPLHVTSYLDALRGFAAIIVVNHHYFPYEPTWFFQLPFVRIFCAGRGMVDVFFVISGYVLSYRMLKLMRTHSAIPLLDSFVSSVFRRYIRLYASAGAATFITMILTCLNWGPPAYRMSSFFPQLWHWIKDLLFFGNPFVNIDGYWSDDVFRSGYLLVTWTIPIEFRGSLIVFLFCIAACKLSTRARMTLCCSIILLCYVWATTYVALFLGGMFIADVSFSRHPERLGPLPTLPQSEKDITLSSRQAAQQQQQHQQPQPKPKPQLPQSQPKQPLSHRVFYSLMFTLAIFLLCQPVSDLKTAAWPWPQLEKVIPGPFRDSLIKEHFWLSIGSLMLVFALDSCPMLQTPFTWNFSQYIGEISFGIYMMHLLILWCLWWKVLNPWRISLLGEAMWTYMPFLVPFHGAILWAADLFCRIDNKIVAFGRTLQVKFFDW